MKGEHYGRCHHGIKITSVGPRRHDHRRRHRSHRVPVSSIVERRRRPSRLAMARSRLGSALQLDLVTRSGYQITCRRTPAPCEMRSETGGPQLFQGRETRPSKPDFQKLFLAFRVLPGLRVRRRDQTLDRAATTEQHASCRGCSWTRMQATRARSPRLLQEKQRARQCSSSRRRSTPTLAGVQGFLPVDGQKGCWRACGSRACLGGGGGVLPARWHSAWALRG